MCLGVPGKVVRWIDRHELFARAEVEFDGVRREVAMDCVSGAAEGEYVIVHAGIAISRIDAEEARRTLEILAAMGELADMPPEGART
jgi:hydrogenase expression/formation protein HypC